MNGSATIEHRITLITFAKKHLAGVGSSGSEAMLSEYRPRSESESTISVDNDEGVVVDDVAGVEDVVERLAREAVAPDGRAEDMVGAVEVVRDEDGHEMGRRCRRYSRTRSGTRSAIPPCSRCLPFA